jgi:hypothetical protein
MLLLLRAREVGLGWAGLGIGKDLVMQGPGTGGDTGEKSLAQRPVVRRRETVVWGTEAQSPFWLKEPVIWSIRSTPRVRLTTIK